MKNHFLKRLAAAGALIIIMALIVPKAQQEQKRKELDDMRVLNISVEVSDEQYLALKRRAARLGAKNPGWTVDDEINYTAAAALALQAEEEGRRERTAIRNAQITDDFITDDTPITITAAQKETGDVTTPTLSEDPQGEPEASATVNVKHDENDLFSGSITDDDLDLFLRCVQAEAGNQPIEGKEACAEVIRNRVNDPRFPGTIRQVILQPGQFAVVANGSINHAMPDEDTRTAVEAALNGSQVLPADYVFFNNRPIGSDVIQIKDHYFGR